MVIDDLVDMGDLPEPTFVKIDVEGAEGQVLKGMRRTVAKARLIVFVECSDAGRETTWPLLSELGYRCQSAMTRKWVSAFDNYRHADCPEGWERLPTFNPAGAGIPGFRPIAPRGLGRPTLPCPRQSTRRA